MQVSVQSRTNPTTQPVVANLNDKKLLPEQITKRKTLKTLIVEDNSTDRELLELQLKNRVAKSKGFNFAITSVSNSTEAIDAATKASQNGGLDLVLMDIRIPGGMNGVEVAREIHAMLPNTPVLFVSASDIGQIRLDLEKTVDSLSLELLKNTLRKPVDKPELLLSAIERLCPSE